MEHDLAVRNLAVESYLLGDMTPGDREAFEEHFFECAVCAEDVRSASQFLEDAREIFAARRRSAMAAKPGRRQEASRWNWPAWLQPQLAAAAFLIVLAVTAVETLSTIPNLRHEVDEARAPRVIKPQVLRPQTRGTSASVNITPGGPLLLALDLPEFPAPSAATGLQFVLKAPDGRTLYTIPGGSLGSGDSVSLSIPKPDLPAGTYDVVVEAAPADGKQAQELARYRFELKRQ